MPNGNKRSIKLSPSDRRGIYAARGFLDSSIEKKLGVRIPFDAYFQDPLVAKLNPEIGFHTDFLVDLTAASPGAEIKDTRVHILGPEIDIDRFYLGKEADSSLQGLQAAIGDFGGPIDAGTEVVPSNISSSDFRVLRSRVLSNSVAFAEPASKVKNNASTVLLIERRGRRLLFVGDTEWEREFKEGKHNGGWNVMWKNRHNHLDKQVHFLKIGHHGSTNATPWNRKQDGETTEPSTILDAILPVPGDPAQLEAKALDSTKRKSCKTIPKSALLVELGKRVLNTRNYEVAMTTEEITTADLPRYANYKKDWLDFPQPYRTDHERVLHEDRAYVEVVIDPQA